MLGVCLAHDGPQIAIFGLRTGQRWASHCFMVGFSLVYAGLHFWGLMRSVTLGRHVKAKPLSMTSNGALPQRESVGVRQVSVHGRQIDREHVAKLRAVRVHDERRIDFNDVTVCR